MSMSEGSIRLSGLETKLAGQTRLGWFLHMQRRERAYFQKMLMIELPGRRERGRAQRRFVDFMKENMHRVGVTEEVAKHGVSGRHMI